MEGVVGNIHSQNISSKQDILNSSWKALKPMHYMKVNMCIRQEDMITIGKLMATTSAWCSKYHKYVNVLNIHNNIIEISHTISELDDEDSSILWYMKEILYSDSSSEKDVFALDYFFDRVDKNNEALVSSAKKVSVIKKEKMPIANVILEIPMRILINSQNSSTMIHIKVNCNMLFDDVSTFLQNLFHVSTINLYDINMEAINLKHKLYENIIPDSLLLGISRTQYKIYKRLELQNSGSWSNDVDNWDAITITPNRAMLICGFTAYTPNSTGNTRELVYKFKVNKKVEVEGKVSIFYDGINKTKQIELPGCRYIHLSAGDNVVLMQYVNGGNTFKGKKSLNCPPLDALKISSAPESQNGTSENEGQIAEIYYI